MDQPELSRHCIPWTPFKASLADATVCIVSSAGVRKKSDPPFNTQGDTTFRTIEGTSAGLTYDDDHYDHACADQDINCIFPIDRLADLQAEGVIKGSAARHFSYGFSMKLRELRDDTFPKLLKEVEAARPDVVVLTGG
jgi:D-proline reductase (dithiol) PrdB